VSLDDLVSGYQDVLAIAPPDTLGLIRSSLPSNAAELDAAQLQEHHFSSV
jgi:hypothetical protein